MFLFLCKTYHSENPCCDFYTAYLKVTENEKICPSYGDLGNYLIDKFPSGPSNLEYKISSGYIDILGSAVILQLQDR